jgi:hypothetical protein
MDGLGGRTFRRLLGWTRGGEWIGGQDCWVRFLEGFGVVGVVGVVGGGVGGDVRLYWYFFELLVLFCYVRMGSR